ncbi:hypothetical protein BDW74DRAFT_167782 [Aspergillus multicolor]|uniref:uncharacterized protein n=1 Tax=Aspergillus multicolor TaxID=41759 RepID=UPI003CCCDAB5
MAATNSLVQSAFQAAMNEFKTNLDNDKLYAEILAVKSINEVYDLTDKLQAEQGKKGQLRHLAKIEPFLNRLREYAGVIEVFLQVQPDIMALIWGPIKLLLQWSSVLTQSFDAIVSAAGDIGLLLPEFQEVMVLFAQNTRLYDVLVLFFKDILEFYQVGLKFFSMARWKYFFESLWPRKRDHISLVKTHIERHTLLMRNEVRLEHIREEHEARLRSLKHFRAAEDSHRLQQYHAIKTDFNPRAYDDKLHWYHGRVCKGTGTWLLEDDAFKKWMDTASKTSRVLWIQGIPGAGKTFLAGTVINQARTTGLTAFAFLTHNLSNSTSALTVVHSLIFQLAGQNEGLQDVICHSVHEHTKSDIKLAVALLKSLLNCVGSAYLIIDGVDEIDMVERRVLLQNLIDLSQDCTAMRLLISSRREDDIVAVLENNAENVQANERNEESIQAFVHSHVREMFVSRNFPPSLLVLSGLDQIDDLAEIHEYLVVLPTDLDAAYARILARIENLRIPLRDKARMILGWLGCSPTPLTIQELAHALTIQPGSLEATKPTAVAPNLGKLCGPIVEITDGYVQFVHFTVKELPLISVWPDATLNLANRCMSLFCQRLYDSAIVDDDAQLVSMLIDGCYNLHYFVTNHWLTLIDNYVRLVEDTTTGISDRLLHHLRLLLSQRGNLTYAAEREAFAEPAYIGRFQQNQPDIYEFLLNSSQFHERCSKNGYHMAKDGSWQDSDPLTVAITSRRLYRKIPLLICPPGFHKATCSCNAVYQCFGLRPFKCGFLQCFSQRHGLVTITELTQHEKSHSRAWKCGFSGCEYEKTGFLSERMREQHLENAHRDTAPDGNIEQDDLDAPDIVPLLIDLIRRDEVATAEILLQGVKPNVLKDGHLDRIQSTLGRFGSIAMLELFYRQHPHPSDLINSVLLLSAIDRGDCVVIRWLFQQSIAVNFVSWRVLFALMTSASPEVYTLIGQVTKSASVLEMYKRSCFLDKIIAATSRITGKEEQLISIWVSMRSNSKSQLTRFSAALCGVARTTCSIPLGEALLKNGAILDVTNAAMISPLCYATRKSSAENAEFIRFLLFAGANPEAIDRSGRKSNSGSRKASDGICAREMSRWLGVTWSELVAQAVEYRKQLEESGNDDTEIPLELIYEATRAIKEGQDRI